MSYIYSFGEIQGVDKHYVYLCARKCAVVFEMYLWLCILHTHICIHTIMVVHDVFRYHVSSLPRWSVSRACLTYPQS